MASARSRAKGSQRAILLMLIINCCSCLLPWKLWISCSVDLPQVKRSSARTASHEVSSSFACASLASQVSWAYLFCYSQADRTCSFWDELSLHPGNVVKDPTLGATLCKTLLHPVAECKLPDGSTATAGEVVASFCADVEDICLADGSVYGKTETGATIHSACVSPFTQKSFGCIMETPELSGWCATRQHCLSNGGDLYVPDTTQQWADVLVYAKGFYYVGCVKEFGVWRWLASSRDPTASGDWHPLEPNNNDGEICGHIFVSADGSGLGDFQCDRYWRAICEVTIAP